MHLAEEVPEQRQDVLGALAQARQVQGAAGDPVVEVVAEGALRLLGREVPVGRADQPERALAPRVAPDALERALLDDAQQLGLERHRELADLVEEERAAVGQLERALAGGGRAGEGALLVAEELAPGQRRDDRAAVEDHQPLLVRPRVELVDELSDPLLAGPALAGDQHRGVGEPRDLDGVAEDRLPGGAVADEEVLDVAAFDAARRWSASGAAAPRPAAPSPPGRTS